VSPAILASYLIQGRHELVAAGPASARAPSSAFTSKAARTLALALAACIAATALAQPAGAPTQLSSEAAARRSRELLSAPITAESAAELALMQSRARQYDQTAQLQIAAVPLEIGAEAKRAWFAAVAAQEALAYVEAIELAASAASDLAAKMREAGNLSQLASLREQAFAADAMTQSLRARQNALATRERLTRIMGAPQGSAAYVIPDRLPALPDSLMSLEAAEGIASTNRLDLIAAKRNVAGTARALGLSVQVGTVDIFGAASGMPGGQTPFGGSFTFPLYDFKVAHPQAESLYRAALARAGEIALYARSEVRETHAAYRTGHEIALRYQNEILPMRKRISKETLLRFNGMLIGIFELLADAREQIAAANAAIEAQRDFWLADTDLRQALAGPVSQTRRLPTQE
jgi:outer membrane protein TolC